MNQEMEIQFINSENYQQVKLIDGVVVHPFKRARRGTDDSRGYLVEMGRSDWKDMKFDTNPQQMLYGSFTYKSIARDEDQWHVHPAKDVKDGVEQLDRWSFIGKAIVVVADSKTSELNLFKIGTGWGDSGFYGLLIPPRKYHGFLSVGGVLDDEGKEGVWIQNLPDHLYDYDNPALIEGRIPYVGSGILLPNGEEFNWNAVRKVLDLGK